MEEYFDARKFIECSKEALAVSSNYIRKAILGEVDLSEYIIKGDKSAVTIVDTTSQALALPIIQRDLGQYRLNQEESDEEIGNLESNIVIYHDPLDGTGGFLVGVPTPTVILGAYDSKNKEVLACGTMEPSTGRAWFSAKGEGAWKNIFDYPSQKWVYENGVPIKVNNHKIKDDSIVLVDIPFPFKRKTKNGLKEMLTQEGRRTLSNELENAGAKESSSQSNGSHYALTAQGRPLLVGNITTAIGGPFDVVGLLHVNEAGGESRCYYLSPSRELIQTEGYDIENADAVIAANNLENLLVLENAYGRAIGKS
ncbi:MAG: inositol monophosphatase family protein [Candidatus Diapherotrites archaeon]